jgi:hypothetical protein
MYRRPTGNLHGNLYAVNETINNTPRSSPVY